MAKIRDKEERYEANVPDTLDLADRAGLAINAMTGNLDPQANYELHHAVQFASQPAYMWHDSRSFVACGPKWLRSLPMMRQMSGSKQNEEIDKKFEDLLVSLIAEDGLLYSRVGPKRPWDDVATEDWTLAVAQGRMMLAMMTLYERDQDPVWLGRTGKMAQALGRIAIHKDDYAYYPSNPGIKGEGFVYQKLSGWLSTEEPASETEGKEGTVLGYHGHQIRALAAWYRMSGDKKALELARKLANFCLKPKFWGTGTKIEGSHVTVLQDENAFFIGHFHGHTLFLRGLLEYAMVANQSRLKDFVRAGYEFARAVGISRIGCFPEGCGIADMTALAIRLTEARIGDYWEDVDRYVRNQLVEQQFLRADLLQEISAASKKHDVKPPFENADRVIERNLGSFSGGLPLMVTALETSAGSCCTGNATEALYYVWKSIVKYQGEVATVNLLLNRASPWIDVDSYLPYEGKVVLKNKTVKKAYVRLPIWVDKQAVRCLANQKIRPIEWFGDYLIVDNLKPQDEITIEFPMREERVSYRFLGGPGDDLLRHIVREHTLHLKGNTLVDVWPREQPDYRGHPYPIYRRDHYKQEKVPMKRVTPYVSPVIFEW